jgi:hypothetical protein
MLLKSLTRFSVGLLLALPVLSHADTLNLTLTERTSRYTWSLPSNPTPFFAKAGDAFSFVDRAISHNGSPLPIQLLPELVPSE